MNEYKVQYEAYLGVFCVKKQYYTYNRFETIEQATETAEIFCNHEDLKYTSIRILSIERL